MSDACLYVIVIATISSKPLGHESRPVAVSPISPDAMARISDGDHEFLDDGPRGKGCTLVPTKPPRTDSRGEDVERTDVEPPGGGDGGDTSRPPAPRRGGAEPPKTVGDLFMRVWPHLRRFSQANAQAAKEERAAALWSKNLSQQAVAHWLDVADIPPPLVASSDSDGGHDLSGEDDSSDSDCLDMLGAAVQRLVAEDCAGLCAVCEMHLCVVEPSPKEHAPCSGAGAQASA